MRNADQRDAGTDVEDAVPVDTLGALAVFEQTGATQVVRSAPANRLAAPAPPPGAGGYPKPWQLFLVRHVFAVLPRALTTAPTAPVPKTASTADRLSECGCHARLH